MLLRPSPRMTPDEWGAAYRRYPVGHDRPGRRDPLLAPYMIPFGRSIASRQYRKVAMACAGQVAKTETLLDVIGQRLDQAPAPILLVGPNKQFLTEQFEPRLMRLLDEAPVLRDKVARGKRMTKTRKVIGGVPLRLAHGGSSTALKSDMFALALTDEADELLANVKGQGDPIGLIDIRGETVADFVHGIVSTPSVGTAETEVDMATGLEFWKVQDAGQIESTIWRIFQEGTRRHWAWQCPHCEDWFIPRMKLLRYDDKASPIEIRRSAFIACPRCGGVIDDSQKAELNARGVYVAPGQRITKEGAVEGDPPAALSDTYWVSGLCSPFRSFGDRAAELAVAKATGDPAKLQTVLSGFFGELTSPLAGGDGLTVEEIRGKRLPYQRGEVPLEVTRIFAAVDVQKRSLFFVIMGFGAKGASWVIDWGQMMGATDQDKVWEDLADRLLDPVQDLMIERALVDSGFRPDKPEAGDVHRVYDFCRVYKPLVQPAKGWDSRQQPVMTRRIEVKPTGKQAPFSIELVHANSDFFKSMLLMRIRIASGHPGALYVPEDVTEDFLEGIASEVRMVENGKPRWQKRHSHNHYLDCAALCQAIGYLENVQRIPDGATRRADAQGDELEPRRSLMSEASELPPVTPATVMSLRQRMAQRAQGLRR